ncbi:MAG: hypothetical protein QOD56_1322 [Gammaproteobacteria bacterium]|nr:hypothetical protein [Gammaproteobacteria bacterium]
MSATAPQRGRAALLRITAGIGAIVGYGCLAAFLWLVGLQVYRWFRDGEWTRIGVNDGLRIGLTRCCVRDADSGRFAVVLHWLDTPVDWLGLHKVLEAMPASLALFAVSILGNSLFIYCRDRLSERKGS